MIQLHFHLHAAQTNTVGLKQSFYQQFWCVSRVCVDPRCETAEAVCCGMVPTRCFSIAFQSFLLLSTGLGGSWGLGLWSRVAQEETDCSRGATGRRRAAWTCVAGALSPSTGTHPARSRWGGKNTSWQAPEGVGCQACCKITSLHLELCKTEPRHSSASHPGKLHQVQVRALRPGSRSSTRKPVQGNKKHKPLSFCKRFQVCLLC